MSKKNVLSVKKLNKIYRGNIHALKDLNLEVKEGEILGLLGPNGAGKSTFINILAGVTDKTSGDVIVWGFNLDKNPRQVRVSLGIVPQEINVDPFFTPKKLLDLQAGLFGVKKKDRITDTILDLVALKDKSNSYTRSLSGGMKRRLLIAKALVHKPPIVILDEPTAGVDVELRRNLWENIRSLRKLGVTIILTTHYLQEAEELCDRVGIIHKGSLIALDTTENMLNKIQTKTIRFEINKKVVFNDKNNKDYNILTNTDSEFKIEYNKQEFNIQKIIKLLENQGIVIKDIKSEDPNLEDVFVNLTNN
jgi:ABC-2 type transport system ATP-binding protein